jgi:1,4-alpha-glucan branching enzyme
MNQIYQGRSPLWERDISPTGFSWLVGDDGAGNTMAFARYDNNNRAIVSVTNFSPVPHELYRLPLPFAGKWIEIFNTDDLKYGGSGVTNTEIVVSNEGLHGYAAQTTLRLPPLATIWLELQI